MRKIVALCAFVTFLALSAFAAQQPQIRGQYLETRSADVYVGQCFANGEVNLAGTEAIVAWHIQEGKWDGVSLAGLSVVGAPIDMEVLREHSGRARLQAGDFVTVETRAIGDKDHLCGNEDTFYPPLTATTHAMPAVAVTDEYQGKDLNIVWTLHDKRSAFVGTFEKTQPLAASH